MFVFLKIVLFFFRPLVWVFVLLLWSLFTRRPLRRKRLLIAAFALLAIFSNPFICRSFVKLYEIPPVHLAANARYPVGIVLGGFVTYNKSEDAAYFNSASDRFIETALLYKTGHIGKVIVAAGNGYIVKHDFHEADFIKQHLIELGIPAADIYTDPYSRNTEENAANSRRVVDSVRLQGPFLLISSAMHLRRASLVFRKKGIDATLYPCDFASENVGNNFLEDYLLPSARALDLWDGLIKEWIGDVAYKVLGKG